MDFGQANVIEQGTRTRMHFLCLTFPYSNAGYLQLLHGEIAECVLGHWFRPINFGANGLKNEGNEDNLPEGPCYRYSMAVSIPRLLL